MISIGLALAFTPAIPFQVTEEAKLVASDGNIADRFGESTAFEDDTLVVGAPFHDNASINDAGAVYIFVRNGSGWTQQKKFIGQVHNDAYGNDVGLSGETVVVGYRLADTTGFPNAGHAFVYTRSGTDWTLEADLSAADPGGSDFFGESVAIDGDRIVVGANRDNHTGNNNGGSAYVFDRTGTTWTQVAKLTASNAQPDAEFGIDVDVDGDTVATGAWLADHLGGNAHGAAYVFVRSGTTWVEQAALMASDTMPFDTFGYTVALSGDLLLVGAQSDTNSNGSSSGSVYAFQRSGTTWTEEQRFQGSNGAFNHRFSTSLALDGNHAVIGTANHTDAYLYRRIGTTWAEQAFFTTTGLTFQSGFGWSSALDGCTLIVGADKADGPTQILTGAAYVYDFASPNLTYCTAGITASGCQASISASGTASASAASGFTVTAATTEGDKDGLFFFGPNGRQANPWGNGTSYQCVAPPVKRGGLLAGSGTAGLCDGGFSQDLNALWCPGCPKPAKNPGAGAELQIQCWFRDPFNSSNRTTSLSNALEVRVCP